MQISQMWEERMAQRIVYRLEDDLDSSEAAETIVFGIDSVSYEIDLSEENGQRLRDLLAPYVAAGRRVGGRRGDHCRDRNHPSAEPLSREQDVGNDAVCVDSPP